MESNVVRHRSQSTTQSQSPKQIPKSRTTATSPPRRPLHERSQSQTNSANSSPTRKQYNGKAFRRDPFPKLPSQVFAPTAGSYIFDETKMSPSLRQQGPTQQLPTIPARSPLRPASPVSPAESSTTTASARFPFPVVPPLKTKPSISSIMAEERPASVRTFGELFEPGAGSGNSRQRSVLQRPLPDSSQISLPRTPASPPPTDPTPRRRTPSKSIEAKVIAAEMRQASRYTPVLESSSKRLQSATSSTPKSTSSRTSEASPASVTPLQQKNINQLSTKPVEKVEMHPGLFLPWQAPKDEKSTTPVSQRERPRSASSPQTPTSEFIQSLTQEGTQVQYPRIRQPSVSSSRSQVTLAGAAGAAYPAPLRLQRKRADSQLGKKASEQPSAGLGQDEGRTTLNDYAQMRQMPSKASLAASATTYESSYGEVLPPHMTHLARHSFNWQDEAGDVVPELDQPLPYLRAQRSKQHLRSVSDSRPTTGKTSNSARSSFYNFLNDSKTAWASVYYSNESRFRLETPPQVTQSKPFWGVAPDPGPESTRAESGRPPTRHGIRPLWDSMDTTSAETMRPRHASMSTVDSAGTSGFPEQLYVRRFRPHVVQHQSNHQPINASFQNPSLRYSTSLSTMRTIHHSQSRSLGDSISTGTNTNYRPESNTIRTVNVPPTPITEPTYPYLAAETPSGISLTSRPDHYGNIITGSGLGGLPPLTPPMTPVGHASPHIAQAYNTTPALDPIPRLSPDKRHTSLHPFAAPSLEEVDSSWSSFLFGPANRQILLFALGFVCPLFWFLGGVLHLPRRPRIKGMRESGVGVGPSGGSGLGLSGSMSGAQRTDSAVGGVSGRFMSEKIDLFDEDEVRRWMKARWWRRVNRGMSVVGLCVLVVVITCAVVGTTNVLS